MEEEEKIVFQYTVEAEIVEDVNFKMSISPVRHDY